MRRKAMFEAALAIIVSLVSLAVSWRAYLISKRGLDVQTQAFALQEQDTRAKQEAKLQVSNETFLSSWQLPSKGHRCAPEEIELHYSALLSNKGETVASVDGITIEVGPAKSPLDEPNFALGHAVSGPLYLSAGEVVSLASTIDAPAISITRQFFQHLEGVLVFTLVMKYRGYAGQSRIYKAEIYRMNHQGGIVTKGNYNAAAGVPRTYLLPQRTPGA